MGADGGARLATAVTYNFHPAIYFLSFKRTLATHNLLIPMPLSTRTWITTWFYLLGFAVTYLFLPGETRVSAASLVGAVRGCWWMSG